MAFPTIPTVASGRVLTSFQANTTATRTFPSLTGLTKNAGDRLIAICIAYQTSTGTNAAFSGWTGSFTEIHDSATSTTLAIGIAEKISDGTETGTIAVTQAGTITGHACFILLSIPGAHSATASEVGGRASGTTALANSAAFNPTNWDVEETLWIAIGASGETSLTGSYTGIGAAAPTNYTNLATTTASADAIGAVQGAVAFRQLSAASEDIGTFGSADVSNARNASVVIAVRPEALVPTTITPVESVSATVSDTAQLTVVAPPTTITPVESVSATVSDTAQLTVTAGAPPTTITPVESISVSVSDTAGLVSPGTPTEPLTLAGTTGANGEVNLTWSAPTGSQ